MQQLTEAGREGVRDVGSCCVRAAVELVSFVYTAGDYLIYINQPLYDGKCKNDVSLLFCLEHAYVSTDFIFSNLPPDVSGAEWTNLLAIPGWGFNVCVSLLRRFSNYGWGAGCADISVITSPVCGRSWDSSHFRLG